MVALEVASIKLILNRSPVNNRTSGTGIEQNKSGTGIELRRDSAVQNRYTLRR